MTTSTACGKVILLGEHAVVYDRPALAAGLSRGAEARVEPGPTPARLEVAPWSVSVEAGDARGGDLARAFGALLEALPGNGGHSTPGVSVRATVHLPGGGGLGSSAALGVAIARAVGLHVLGRALEQDETLAAALAWERVFHGNPSGVDAAMAVRGGAGVFSRREPFEAIALRTPLRLVIADTGERTSTRTMVEGLARLHARHPRATTKAFDAIAALVGDAALALGANDLARLGQLMDLNQVLLAGLMLSTERTEALCRAARDAGAIGAKLTGGGGGGCIVALPGAHEDRVCAALARDGAPCFVAEVRAT